MPWLQVQLFTSWQIMEKRITEPRIAQLVQSLSTSYILFTTVLLGIHPEREPSLLGEWICSSLYNRLSLTSFPFLPEYLLYLHTVPHVRETVASKTDQLLLPWSLQKGNQPKDGGGGCCGECGGGECQRASIKVWRARRKTRPGDEKRELQPGPQEKHVQSAGGKKLIFEKINQSDKTGKTDQIKRGQGEQCKYYYGWRHRTSS